LSPSSSLSLSSVTRLRGIPSVLSSLSSSPTTLRGIGASLTSSRGHRSFFNDKQMEDAISLTSTNDAALLTIDTLHHTNTNTNTFTTEFTLPSPTITLPNLSPSISLSLAATSSSGSGSALASPSTAVSPTATSIATSAMLAALNDSRRALRQRNAMQSHMARRQSRTADDNNDNNGKNDDEKNDSNNSNSTANDDPDHRHDIFDGNGLHIWRRSLRSPLRLTPHPVSGRLVEEHKQNDSNTSTTATATATSAASSSNNNASGPTVTSISDNTGGQSPVRHRNTTHAHSSSSSSSTTSQSTSSTAPNDSTTSTVSDIARDREARQQMAQLKRYNDDIERRRSGAWRNMAKQQDRAKRERELRHGWAKLWGDKLVYIGDESSEDAAERYEREWRLQVINNNSNTNATSTNTNTNDTNANNLSSPLSPPATASSSSSSSPALGSRSLDGIATVTPSLSTVTSPSLRTITLENGQVVEFFDPYEHEDNDNAQVGVCSYTFNFIC
jgi:hypothetical protein